MRNKGAAIILGFALVILHLAILFAGFIAPYDPAAQNRDLSYAPPTHLHFFDSSGFHLRPFVYASVPDFDAYHEDMSREYPVHFFTRGARYHLLWIFTEDIHLFGVDAPGRVLLLGTDLYGRDEFSRMVYGGQISLAAGLLATFITLTIATIVGMVSGYYGRWIDESLMGCSELFLSLPWFYFLIGVRAFLPLHLDPASTFLLLIAVIGAIGWARPARLVRGITLSARNRNYVLAARGFGGSDFYLLRRHVLPEIFGVLLTQAALLVPQYVAAEATLSFFGLGIGEPMASWGNMLSTLQQYNVLVSYHWLLAPALALVVTSVMYWMLADTLHHWLQSHSI
ncbi:MAG TPA: ABC transporter permease [Verrucomicrobiae bacterium]|jgi:peptide/nickel transport system permease protein|nr:ABC transporter permease [Verrucomicrobiae bacterium]